MKQRREYLIKLKEKMEEVERKEENGSTSHNF